MKKFTKETLEVQCDTESLEGCDDKQKEYIAKMKGKGADKISKELVQLFFKVVKSGKCRSAQDKNV